MFFDWISPRFQYHRGLCEFFAEWGQVMPPIEGQAIERVRRDHEHLLELAHRIQAVCSQRDKVRNCSDCHANSRHVCHGNIEQLVRLFIEATLKHNVIESIYMDGCVPHAHQVAHNQAHTEIAHKLKEIRVEFSEDGNCIVAIAGIDDVLVALHSHFEEYDSVLESYLLEVA
jgi:hemerythrin